MISSEKVKRFMWFSLGIAGSLLVLLLLQKMFGG